MTPPALQSAERFPAPARATITALLAALFLAEAVLFYLQAATNVAPFFPPAADQVGYLIPAYNIASIARSHGLSSLLWESITPHLANTASFPSQGAAMILLTGLPRVGALTVHLGYFLLLQLVVYRFAAWKRRNDYDGWIIIGLVLLLQGTFAWAGGIFDFRIDFTAMCLLGIWTCLVLRSGVFRRRRWSLAAGLVAAWLAGTRYISVVYLGSIMATVLAVNLMQAVRASSRIGRALAWTRACNVVLSGLIVVAVVAPLLWLSRHMLREYYYESLFVSAEAAIRSKEFVGSDRLLDHLMYYPSSIAFHHIGSPLLRVCGVLLGCVLVLSVLAGAPPRAGIMRSLRRWRSELGFLAVVILLPLGFVNLSIHKSPVIGGILCVPILLLVCCLAWALLDAARAAHPTVPLSGMSWQSLGRKVAIGVMTLAMLVFAYRMAGPRINLDRTELVQINTFTDALVGYVLDNRLLHPRMSVDRIDGFLGGPLLTVAAYERYGQLTRVAGGLGHGIFGPSRDEAIRLLADSDIVVLTSPAMRAHTYPFDQSIQEYWPQLLSWVQSHMLPLVTMDFRGVPYRAFVLPVPRLSGLTADGWITSAGLTLEVEASSLRRWPYVVLSGVAHYEQLGGEPLAKASVLDATGAPAGELPVRLTASGRRYEIVIDGRTAPSPASNSVRIALTFDRHFVPRQLGISGDTRELVLMAPSRQALRAQPPQ